MIGRGALPLLRRAAQAAARQREEQLQWQAAGGAAGGAARRWFTEPTAATKEAVERTVVVNTLDMSRKFEAAGLSRAQAETMTEHITTQLVLDRMRLSEKKQAEQEGRAREARLSRALEEAERCRAALEEAKARARDGRDAAGAEAARGAAERAKLERQRNALLAAFRKQLRLIDVLRRQKAHLEAARCLAFTEEEFMRTLEQGGG
ncbi:hypothetical protein Rsub_13272 [Raphidocelis subcapitata]|uniref:Uncharacterized protein n=1 Tax=Raphidocelis subcapitata TaxID=307507 RepID=A0A2V0PL89_9CHLO|nr:hypothetical protein Rsub_13272 [Raphidocelis subcapitata]|eukprot:GBG00569.1 hypothetical protein Rsub_13272 [Raphidocelis subcapitata]